MKTNEIGLSAFSEETLKEMDMENVEGGGAVDLNISKCKGTVNNCSGGNCPCQPATPIQAPPKEVETT